MHMERVELLSNLSLIFCHSQGTLEASGEEAGRLHLGELKQL